MMIVKVAIVVTIENQLVVAIVSAVKDTMTMEVQHYVNPVMKHAKLAMDPIVIIALLAIIRIIEKFLDPMNVYVSRDIMIMELLFVLNAIILGYYLILSYFLVQNAWGGIQNIIVQNVMHLINVRIFQEIKLVLAMIIITMMEMLRVNSAIILGIFLFIFLIY